MSRPSVERLLLALFGALVMLFAPEAAAEEEEEAKESRVEWASTPPSDARPELCASLFSPEPASEDPYLKQLAIDDRAVPMSTANGETAVAPRMTRGGDGGAIEAGPCSRDTDRTALSVWAEDGPPRPGPSATSMGPDLAATLPEALELSPVPDDDIPCLHGPHEGLQRATGERPRFERPPRPR